MPEIDAAALARSIHVLAVVLWIGGVAFVAAVLLPSIRRLGSDADRMALFERIEGRFAAQSRVTTLLAGLSGLYLVDALDLWQRFLSLSYWWMHAMVLVWLAFIVVLFVAEPLFLHRWFRRRATRDPDGTFRLIGRLHWLLLSVSLATAAGAVAGSHGW
jgi:uncharacterized membrane protein